MSHQTFEREYDCDGCGNAEPHRHRMVVDVSYSSMIVRVDRYEPNAMTSIFFSWPEWKALREMVNEEAL